MGIPFLDFAEAVEATWGSRNSSVLKWGRCPRLELGEASPSGAPDRHRPDQSMEVGHTQQNGNFRRFWLVLLLYSEYKVVTAGYAFLGLLCVEYIC